VLQRVSLGFFFAAALIPSVVVKAQSTPNIAAVFSARKVSAGTYTNDFFGLTLTPAKAHFTQGGFVSAQAHRARLVDAQSDAKDETRYEIAVLADARSIYPPTLTAEQYVRSVRHQMESQGAQTIQQEQPVKISGVSFVGAIVETAAQNGQAAHYLGIYSTLLNGYVLSVQPEATSEDNVKKIILTMVRFKLSTH